MTVIKILTNFFAFESLRTLLSWVSPNTLASSWSKVPWLSVLAFLSFLSLFTFYPEDLPFVTFGAHWARITRVTLLSLK